MQKTDYPKLRNCPFCGGEAKLGELNTLEAIYYKPMCKNCGCNLYL